VTRIPTFGPIDAVPAAAKNGARLLKPEEVVHLVGLICFERLIGVRRSGDLASPKSSLGRLTTTHPARSGLVVKIKAS